MDNKGVQDMTQNGSCSRCGSCCGLFIPFTDKELLKIKKYVREHNIKPYNRINAITGQFNAHCCFYDESKKICRVYEARPYVCRDFICNRKNWKTKRDSYEKRAKYNSTLNNKMIMASFDDLIYDDYEPILRYIFSLLPIQQGGGVESKHLIAILKQINRLDLLKYIEGFDEKGDCIKGEDMLKEE